MRYGAQEFAGELAKRLRYYEKIERLGEACEGTCRTVGDADADTVLFNEPMTRCECGCRQRKASHH